MLPRLHHAFGAAATLNAIAYLQSFLGRARGRTDLLFALGLAAGLRFGVFLAAVSSPRRFWSQDDREYLGIARHLHDSYLVSFGHWFDLGLRRPPMYPLFLRGIFEVFGWHYAAVVVAQIVISVATVGLVYWLAGLLLPGRLPFVAAFLLAIDPASIVFANQLMTETVFAFLLTLALCLLVTSMQRWQATGAALAGLLLGGAVLTRPVALYLPLLLLSAVIAVSRGRRRASLVLAAALLAGFAVPAGGWLWRNHHTTGVATISTIEGYNMWHYRAVGALVESGQKPWDARAFVEAQLAPHVRRGENAAEISREQLRVGLHVLADHPVGAAKSWGRGEARLLFGPARAETATLLVGRTKVREPWLRAAVVGNELITLATLVAAAMGVAALAMGRFGASKLWLLVVAAAYLLVVSAGPEAYSRFRVPVAPLLVVLAAAAVPWFKRGRGQAVRDV